MRRLDQMILAGSYFCGGEAEVVSQDPVVALQDSCCIPFELLSSIIFCWRFKRAVSSSKAVLFSKP